VSKDGLVCSSQMIKTNWLRDMVSEGFQIYIQCVCTFLGIYSFAFQDRVRVGSWCTKMGEHIKPAIYQPYTLNNLCVPFC
jgi:hypothetical protein